MMGTPTRLIPNPPPWKPRPKPPPLGMMRLLCRFQFCADLLQDLRVDHSASEKHASSFVYSIFEIKRPGVLQQENHRRGAGGQLLDQFLHILCREQSRKVFHDHTVSVQFLLAEFTHFLNGDLACGILLHKEHIHHAHRSCLLDGVQHRENLCGKVIILETNHYVFQRPISIICLLFSQCPCVPPDNAFCEVERKLSFIPLSTMTSYSHYCITLSLSSITKLSLFPLYRIKLLQKEVIGEERAAIRSSGQEREKTCVSSVISSACSVIAM